MLFHEKDSGSRNDEANKSVEQRKIRLQAKVEEFPDLVANFEVTTESMEVARSEDEWNIYQDFMLGNDGKEYELVGKFSTFLY